MSMMVAPYVFANAVGPTGSGFVILTTTGPGSWTVPAGFDPANNIIEIIAGGGDSDGNSAHNGGGGQYAATSNLALSPGAEISYQVGIGGGAVGTSAAPGAADSWFQSSTATLYAQGGGSNSASSFGSPGGKAPAVGVSIVRNGGDGGNNAGSAFGASGGGGAGGPNGAGAKGASINTNIQWRGGQGGGGANGGAVGGASPSGGGTPSPGGNGGNGRGGSGGGAGSAAIGTPAAAGSNGGGGGGGAGANDGASQATTGGKGGTESVWGAGIGPGGGGGGGGGGTNSAFGGAGGTYGGGAGMSQKTGTVKGGQGLLVIRWGTFSANINAAPVFSSNPTMTSNTGFYGVGDTLTVVPGSTYGSVTGTTWQWYADGVAITGATAQSFTLTTTQLGKSVSVRQTATSSGGSTSADSPGTAAVPNPTYTTFDWVTGAGDQMVTSGAGDTLQFRVRTA